MAKEKKEFRGKLKNSEDEKHFYENWCANSKK